MNPNVTEFKFTGRVSPDVLRHMIAGSFGTSTWDDLMIKVSVQGVTAESWDQHEKEEEKDIDKAAKEVKDLIGGLLDAITDEKSDVQEQEVAKNRR